jgi:O-antigen chain-terminating methyltransferase
VYGELEAWLDAASGGDDEFVERVWRLILRRAVEPEARAYAVSRLASGELSRSGLIRELTSSKEFGAVALLDDAVAWARAERDKSREVRGPARPRDLGAPAWSDERAIEIPWCLARYDGERRVLDVGYAFAEPAYLTGLGGLGAEELTGVDLAEAAVPVPPLRGVVADVRKLPLAAGSIDLVLCISTLEHVGRDNVVYGVEAGRDRAGDDAALLELRSVLAPEGRLLLSVPTGEPDDQGWQVQRSPQEWVERFERAGFLVFEDELYARANERWRSVDAATAAVMKYGEGGPGAGAVLVAELRPARLSQRLRLTVRDARHREVPRRSV